MVNVDQLRIKIAEAGLTIPALAAQMKLNPATLYRRLANGETFTIGEASQIAGILHLTADESVSIFFNRIVA